MLQAFEAIRDFMELGGDVLWAILVLTFFMWMLIIERFWYFRTAHKDLTGQIIASWDGREDTTSWYAHRIREALISQVHESLNASVPMIKTLVALCPLLGLLGTVTGMIKVFEVMAVSGSGNVRAMAAGVSQATVPTMAGMVGALSGVLLITLLSRRAAREIEFLEDSLTMDH